MVGMAHKEIPDISLDVYGYRDGRNHDAAKKKIDAMIEKYHADNYVNIHDYDPDLDSQRDNHQVYVVFSTMEGFNIALMEAQNHGEASIANDVNYGPNELTVTDKNGYVVGYDDVKGASEKLVKMFKDPELLQKLSNGAYELSKRYNADAIHDGWMKLTKQAEAIWQERNRRSLPSQGMEEFDDRDAQGLTKQQRKDLRPTVGKAVKD